MQSSVAAAFVWYLSDGLISFLEAQVQLAVDRSSFRYFCFLRSHIGLLASQHLWKNLEHLKKLNRSHFITCLLNHFTVFLKVNHFTVPNSKLESYKEKNFNFTTQLPRK